MIKKKAVETGISPQLVMQNYMMERLLERIALSEYRNNFILKGGFLIAAIVGLDTRATRDIDTTVKGIDLTHKEILSVFSIICDTPVHDDISFSIVSIDNIRDGDDYPGISLSLRANYPPLSVSLTVDITTGDIITPSDIEYSIPMLFENRSISIRAYNIETILAEKLETIVSRGNTNTRLRDFYDVYILYTLKKKSLKIPVLQKALTETSEKRGSISMLPEYESIILAIRKDSKMNNFWRKYRKDYHYASDIEFETVCDTINGIFKSIVL
jgi:predicted nucleotidyltransferase component of viral defense system